MDPFYNIMRVKIETNHWRGKDTEYIVEGSDTLRKDAIYRNVTAWLRAQGWTTQKTNHALRAYSGSMIAMKYGIYDAQCWLRHSTVKVTENHYSHFVRQSKPTNLDDLAARWAVAGDGPQL